jgi:hypothetical protein
MKKLILLLVLLMSVSIMEAQYTTANGGMKIIGPRNGRTGTSYVSWSQSARSDTSQAISLLGWAHAFYNLGSSDSSSVTISYMPSFDGVTFGPAVVIDSLSTATAGDAKSIELPTAAKGLRSVKFVRTVNVFRLGVTTPTLKEQIILTK